MTDQLAVAHAWPTNAALVVDVFALLDVAGLAGPDAEVLDVTYGDGLWWTKHRPTWFLWHARADDPSFDFRRLPYPSDWCDVVVFDPPYCGKGGRETSGLKRMDATYGLTDSPANPDALLAMNIAGLTEACRVARRVVLLKSMDFVTGGELHPHTRHLEHHAEQLGWAVYERLVHLPTGGRPQPATSPCRRCGGTGHQRLRVHPACEHCAGRGDIVRRQLRARRRPSTLTILVPRHLRRGAA